jgi:hypothetical protein
MTKVARRDFLRLGASRGRQRTELSCERLYMRYLDSIDECTTADLRDSIERDLRDARMVRLTAAAWLSREDFRAWMDPLVARLEARGVRVVFD